MGYVLYVLNGQLRQALERIDSELLPYLMRYGSQQLEQLDRTPVRRLIAYADGIGKIIERENGK